MHLQEKEVDGPPKSNQVPSVGQYVRSHRIGSGCQTGIAKYNGVDENPLTEWHDLLLVTSM
jgi:hypothetical protein